jgi:hypothetical protein
MDFLSLSPVSVANSPDSAVESVVFVKKIVDSVAKSAIFATKT